MANSASTPLALAKDFALITLGAADQTANLTANNHVEFDTVVGNLALSTGAGQADGKVTLLAGRTYKLTGALLTEGSAASYMKYQWYDVTNSVLLGIASWGIDITNTGFYSPQSNAMAIVTPATNIQVELRITDMSNIATIHYEWSHAYIESVQAYVPMSATQSYIRRTNGLTRGSTNTNVVIFGTADVSVGTDITYQNSATNGDSFLINTSGIYSLSFTAGLGTANTTIDLRVGSAIDNANLNSNSRASVRSSFGGADPVSVAWTGYIAAGQVAWVFASNDLAGASYTAITVARVR